MYLLSTMSPAWNYGFPFQDSPTWNVVFRVLHVQATGAPTHANFYHVIIIQSVTSWLVTNGSGTWARCKMRLMRLFPMLNNLSHWSWLCTARFDESVDDSLIWQEMFNAKSPCRWTSMFAFVTYILFFTWNYEELVSGLFVVFNVRAAVPTVSIVVQNVSGGRVRTPVAPTSTKLPHPFLIIFNVSIKIFLPVASTVVSSEMPTTTPFFRCGPDGEFGLLHRLDDEPRSNVILLTRTD